MLRKLASLSLAMLVLTAGWAGAGERASLDKVVSKDAVLFVQMSKGEIPEGAMNKSGMVRLWNNEQIQKFVESIKGGITKTMEKGRGEFLDKLSKERNWSDEERAAFEKQMDELTGFDKLAAMFQGEVAFAVEAPADGVFDSSDDLSIIMIADVNEQQEMVGKVMELFTVLMADDLFPKNDTLQDIAITRWNALRVDETASPLEISSLTTAMEDGYFVAGTQAGAVVRTVKALKDGLAENLTTEPLYQKALEVLPEDSMTRYFLNTEAIMKVLPEPDVDAAETNGKPKKPSPEEVLQVLGLENMKMACASLSLLPDGEMKQAMYLHVPGEKKGLMKVLSQSSAPMKLPAYLPANAMMYESLRISTADAYAFTEEAAEELKPGSAEKMNARLDEIKEKFGVDIKGTLLGALGEEVSMLMIIPSTPPINTEGMSPFMAQMILGMQMSGIMSFTAEVKDPEVVKLAMGILFSEMAKKSPTLGTMGTETYNGYTIQRLGQSSGGMGMPGMPIPCYTVTDKRLFMAFSMDAMKQILDAAKGKPEGMAAMPELTGALAAMGKEPAVGIYAMDQGRYLGWYGNFLKQMLQAYAGMMQMRMQANDAGGADDWGGDADAAVEAAPPADPVSRFIDFSLWPDASLFEKYLGYTVGKVYPTDEGIMVKTVSIKSKAEESNKGE